MSERTYDLSSVTLVMINGDEITKANLRDDQLGPLETKLYGSGVVNVDLDLTVDDQIVRHRRLIYLRHVVSVDIVTEQVTETLE